MRTQTRVGVFETNSSSSHSITLPKSEARLIGQLYVDADGICRIYPGEFGWGFDRFTDAATKASYALTWIKAMPVFDLEPLFGPQISVEMRLQNIIALRMSAKVLFCPTRIRDLSGDYVDSWGYIDHQSIEDQGGAASPLFQNDQLLERFIFDPQCVLTIDHDNY